MMKKSIKKRWIAALRSGKFRQGEQMLMTDDGAYCCLGVLCRLYTREKKKKFDKVVIYSRTTWLPEEVAEWAGVDRKVGAKPFTEGFRDSLSDLNDGVYGNVSKNFNQIADIIEEKL